MRYRHIAGCLVIISIMACVQAPRVQAWNGEGVTLAAQPYDGNAYMKEIEQPTTKIELMGWDEQIRSVSAHIYAGKSVKLAQLAEGGGWAIVVGTDSVYRKLNVTDGGGVMVASGTNRLIVPVRGAAMDGFNMMIVDDVSQALSPNHGPHGVVVSYSIKPELVNFWLQYNDSDGMKRYPYVYGMTYSANQRFGVFWLNWEQFVRVDLTTGESKVFMSARGNWYDGVYARRASAITNDGRYVFVDDGSMVIDVQTTCGFSINPRVFMGVIDDNYIRCPSYVYDPSEVAGYNGRHQYFRLAADEQSATYWMTIYPYTSQIGIPTKVTMTAKPSDTKKLSYLALGDSYSSGEGDTEINPTTKKKYYTHGTDVEATSSLPREKCHISSRSYPFLLGSFMQLSDDMQSVACSGALVDDLSGEGGYLGQANSDGSPRLSGISNSATLQSEAMQKFIPGRIRQIEFVKKYQPSAITLTAGGNDAKFAKILLTCINMPVLGSDTTPTCYFADSNGGRGALKKLISDRYEPLKNLYMSLHEASGSSKIYVLGYPQFVNADAPDSQCKANVRLNKAERIMIRESVSYMNNVIKSAAVAAGVKYVDVSDALTGHRLCDSSDNPGGIYVTGIAFLGSSEAQESFHPNDGAHIMIAKAIKQETGNQSLLDYNYCPEGATACPDKSMSPPVVPNYFEGLATKNTKTLPLVPTKTQRGSQIVAVADAGTLQPDSALTVKLYSREYQLLGITTTGDGGVRAQVSIPADIEPGFHTIVFSGVSPSGEAVDIVNFLEIYATENDKDGDGVLDAIDQCVYVPATGVDEDKDSIDDGCDLYISTPSLPKDPASNSEGTAQTASPSDLPLTTQDTLPIYSRALKTQPQLAGIIAGHTGKSETPLGAQVYLPQLRSDDTAQMTERNENDLPLVGQVVLAGIASLAGFSIGRLVSRKRV